MGKKFKSYKPTVEEKDVIERAGMAAAWKKLQEWKNHDELDGQNTIVCIGAVRDAYEAVREETERLRKKKKADYVSHHVEVMYLVCSALFGVDMDSPDDIAPFSVGGAQIISLLRAAKILGALESVSIEFDGDDALFGSYVADEALLISKSCNGGK